MYKNKPVNIVPVGFQNKDSTLGTNRGRVAWVHVTRFQLSKYKLLWSPNAFSLPLSMSSRENTDFRWVHDTNAKGSVDLAATG